MRLLSQRNQAMLVNRGEGRKSMKRRSGQCQGRAPKTVNDWRPPSSHLRAPTSRLTPSTSKIALLQLLPWLHHYEYSSSRQNAAHHEATADALSINEATPPAATSPPNKPTIPYYEDNATGEGRSKAPPVWCFRTDYFPTGR
jgi:hypothetical protein